MTEAELKNQLFKISVFAIYQLSNESSDPITIQESLERKGILNPTIDPIQILNVKSLGDSEKIITFKFSQRFLNINPMLAREGRLNELEWTFQTPAYDYGDSVGDESTDNEEGAANWVARGVIEITQKNNSVLSLNSEEFCSALI